MPDPAPLGSDDPHSLGAYELIGRLGEGGQGMVYLGRDRDGTLAAVKSLHGRLSGDPSARARMAREATAAQRVEAFCTARVLDYDVDGERPYIVSEYIDGPSLHEVVMREGPRTGAALDRLAIGTATALAAIHQHGIVHRDFKPANVLIGPDGPRVVDFGIARATDLRAEPLTAAGAVVGTPGFLAPEQLTGDPLGPPVDVFAWGATMVFAASGRLPFEATSLADVVNRVLHREPDLGNLAGSLRGLVDRCLAKDPRYRPEAREILLDLLAQAGSPSGDSGDLLDAGTRIAARAPGTPVPPVLPPPPPPPSASAPPPRGPAPRAAASARPVRAAAPRGPVRYPPAPPRRSSRGPAIALGCALAALLLTGGCLGLAALVNSRNEVAASGSASSPTPAAARVPASFGGTWRGVLDAGEDGDWEATITLLPGLANGWVRYRATGEGGGRKARARTGRVCAGRLAMIGGDETSIRLSERITEGPCDGGRQLTLTLLDAEEGEEAENDRLRYRAKGGAKATGTLTK